MLGKITRWLSVSLTMIVCLDLIAVRSAGFAPMKYMARNMVVCDGKNCYQVPTRTTPPTPGNIGVKRPGDLSREMDKSDALDEDLYNAQRKRPSSYVRFGKRSLDYESINEPLELRKRPSSYVRFGKRPSSYVRFGKRSGD